MKKYFLTLILCSLLVVGCSSDSSINNKQREGTHTSQTKSSDKTPAMWFFDEGTKTWKSSPDAPPCDDPFVFDQSPVNVSAVTSVLYPGQTRGNNYKAHGGFAFDNSQTNEIAVSLPLDAFLVEGSRYIESGEVQYLLDFVSDCGIAVRFDHLRILSDDVMKIIDDNFPEAKVNESRTTKVHPAVKFQAGDSIATSVGFIETKNVSFDFGVYDYRQRNEASKDPTFASEKGLFASQTFYGVCWFSMLPQADAQRIQSLPSRDVQMGTTSDYC